MVTQRHELAHGFNGTVTLLAAIFFCAGCRRYRPVMLMYGSPNMTFQHPVSMSTALSEGGSGCNQRGSDGARGLGCPINRNGCMRAAGGRNAAAMLNIHSPMRNYPWTHPLIRSGDGKAFLNNRIVEGSPYLSKDYKLEADNDICGRHFLFDKKYEKLQRTSMLIPPLPKDYHVHRSGNLQRLSLPKELSHGPAVRPFTLSCYEEYDLNTRPATLFPSALVLNGRDAISVNNYKFSRPKVNYQTCNLFTFRDDQRRGPSFLDPMIGAPHSFIHRISEMSSLEGETVRQERIKKMTKSRKPDS